MNVKLKSSDKSKNRSSKKKKTKVASNLPKEKVGTNRQIASEKVGQNLNLKNSKPKLELPSEPPVRGFPLFKFNVTDGKKWYEYQYPEVLSAGDEQISQVELTKYSEYADKLIENDVMVFSKSVDKTSDIRWLQKVGSGGTSSDRTASLALLVQESPGHSAKYLDQLISRINNKSRREAHLLLDTVRELFIDDLVPEGRKLVPFAMRPLAKLTELSSGNKDTRDRRLLLWKMEDDLKNKYKFFVEQVEQLCHDSIIATRSHSIKTMFELLCKRSENEQFLLSSIVNKLGDTSYKVAANTSNYLCKLSANHPNMKQVIHKNIHQLIYRPNMSQRAQFYAVCTLSQMQMRSGLDMDLAIALVNTYIGLFKLLIQQGQIENRMLGVLLQGMKRAFPYTKGKTDAVLGEVDTLYKVVGVSKLGTALQTLALLQHILFASEGLSDRFYCALYRTLWDSDMKYPLHHAQFFHLMHKTLKADTVQLRVMAFIKRLLQLSLQMSAAFACASCMLISELRKENKDIIIVYKSAEAAVAKLDGSDDEDEHFVDVDKIEQPNVINNEKKKNGWIHRRDANSAGAMSMTYDPLNRNPLFSGADQSVAYELLFLSKHSHPTVAMFANNLIQGEAVEYSGDPLQDFTPIRFLDRFVFRNPKKSDTSNKKTEKSESHNLLPSRRRSYRQSGAKSVAVNSEGYVKLDTVNVPVDERYLHAYMKHVGVVKHGNDSDGESVDSDEFDTVIDKFEPGQSNDDFLIDFKSAFDTREMGEKQKKQIQKKKKRMQVLSSEDDSDSDVDPDADAAFSSAHKFSELLEGSQKPDDFEKKRKSKGFYQTKKKKIKRK